MICSDCDNNFVFINALQCRYNICILFFLFSGYKLKNQKTKKKTIKQKKNNIPTFDFEKTWFFAPLSITPSISFDKAKSKGKTRINPGGSSEYPMDRMGENSRGRLTIERCILAEC